MAFHTLFCFLLFSYMICSFSPSNLCPSLYLSLPVLHFPLSPLLSLPFSVSTTLPSCLSTTLCSSLLHSFLFSLYYTPFLSFSTTVPSSHPSLLLLLLFLFLYDPSTLSLSLLNTFLSLSPQLSSFTLYYSPFLSLTLLLSLPLSLLSFISLYHTPFISLLLSLSLSLSLTLLSTILATLPFLL